MGILRESATISCGLGEFMSEREIGTETSFALDPFSTFQAAETLRTGSPRKQAGKRHLQILGVLSSQQWGEHGAHTPFSTLQRVPVGWKEGPEPRLLEASALAVTMSGRVQQSHSSGLRLVPGTQ